MTYILNGEIIEHRSDVEGALVRKAGDCTLDVNGIAQWWENTSDIDVHLFTVDLYDPSIPADHKIGPASLRERHANRLSSWRMGISDRDNRRQDRSSDTSRHV